MKKIFIFPMSVALLFSLTACGNSNNDSKNDNNTKTVKSTKRVSKDTKHKINKQEKNKDQANEAQNSNQNSSVIAKNSNSKDQDSGVAATNNQSSKQKNVVNNETEAINTLKTSLGNNDDFVYSCLSSSSDKYVIRVYSKSLQAGGGTGTVGVYDVMNNGSYKLAY